MMLVFRTLDTVALVVRKLVPALVVDQNSVGEHKMVLEHKLVVEVVVGEHNLALTLALFLDSIEGTRQDPCNS